MYNSDDKVGMKMDENCALLSFDVPRLFRSHFSLAAQIFNIYKVKFCLIHTSYACNDVRLICDSDRALSFNYRDTLWSALVTHRRGSEFNQFFSMQMTTIRLAK